jgi:hypothetical protein
VATLDACVAGAGVNIHVEVPRVPFQKLSDERHGDSSTVVTEN